MKLLAVLLSFAPTVWAQEQVINAHEDAMGALVPLILFFGIAFIIAESKEKPPRTGRAVAIVVGAVAASIIFPPLGTIIAVIIGLGFSYGMIKTFF